MLNGSGHKKAVICSDKIFLDEEIFLNGSLRHMSSVSPIRKISPTAIQASPIYFYFVSTSSFKISFWSITQNLKVPSTAIVILNFYTQ